MAQKTYEAMFIADPGIASREWPKVTEELERILHRYGCEIVSLKKWGERKLMYPIRKNMRGTYVLCYFKGPATSLQNVRNDLHLSEVVLRFMILTHDGEVREQEAPKDFETIGVRSEPGAAPARAPEPREPASAEGGR
jgi:small subunit ribosomal protein S6